MGGFGGKNWELDTFHENICKASGILKCFLFFINHMFDLFFKQVKLLFVGEKKVCDQIFEGIGPQRELCFAEVTGNSVAILLSFGEAIAKSKRSPEKLFVILDMYEIMRELHLEVLDYIFFSIQMERCTHWHLFLDLLVILVSPMCSTLYN